MSLKKYKEKRSFEKTPEPADKMHQGRGALRFVVQKHQASHLHYDFRLEMEGVLKSWAVPKGPSMNPNDKRLAMMVEDHPYDYRTFEGTIPEGNYGAGTVMVWDEGTYEPYQSQGRAKDEEELLAELHKGHLTIILNGSKLKGEFGLIKLHGDRSRGENSWLLIKADDAFASKKDITKEDLSAVTGRTMQQIAEGEDVWQSNRKTKKKNATTSVPEAGTDKMPHNVKPMLATLVDSPFNKAGWIFEDKFDGFRAIAEVSKGDVQLYSRNQLSFNENFSPVAESLKNLSHDAVLDGEIVAEDSKGNASFQLLQNYQKDSKGKLVYYIFDLLYLDGHDLRDLPLVQRKELLEELLRLSSLKNVKYSKHILENGIEYFEKAKKRGIEGIMGKDGQSIYRAGARSDSWLKVKTHKRQEVVIGGWTEPRGSRKHIGALIAGVYDSGELVYVGHSGGGLNSAGLEDLYNKLKKIEVAKSPFVDKFKTNAPAHWVKPKLVAEVSFQEWTSDGHMRQPIFEGLRDDKKPTAVTRETAQDTGKELKQEEMEKTAKSPKKNKVSGEEAEQVEFTHLDKIFWPKEKYTKGDLIEYYDKISPYILPYLKDRPESLNRFPNGINGQSFFQKDTDHQGPAWLKKIAIRSESEGKDINYILCQDKATLLYLANLGCIEINPWSSRVSNLDNPDFLVIDLDPEKISFEKVIEAAQETRKIFDSLGIDSYCKTSGATGLHIFVPMGAKYNYDQIKEFARIIATLVNNRLPKTTSLERSPSKRQKKIYLDFLQNRKGQTLAAPYSVRPKPGATVSTPLKWAEVKPGLSPQDFNIKNIFSRIEKVGDLWKPVLGKGANLEKALKKLG